MNSVTQYVDEVVPPKARQQYWDKSSKFAKENPLAFSFILIQAMFSSGPLFFFGTVSASTLLVTIATALITTLGVIGATLFATLPVLFVTASAATITWIGLVMTYVVITWLYNAVYYDSSVQHSLHDFSSQAAATKRHIDQNGSHEFNGYVSTAQDAGNEVKQNAEQGYAQLQNAGYKVKNNVQQRLQPIKDNATAAWNGTAETAGSMKDDLLKDDGVVDGLNAKKDRAAKTVAEKTK